MGRLGLNRLITRQSLLTISSDRASDQDISSSCQMSRSVVNLPRNPRACPQIYWLHLQYHIHLQAQMEDVDTDWNKHYISSIKGHLNSRKVCFLKKKYFTICSRTLQRICQQILPSVNMETLQINKYWDRTNYFNQLIRLDALILWSYPPWSFPSHYFRPGPLSFTLSRLQHSPPHS